MSTVFFFCRLRPEASSAAYEAWVREVDLPRARALEVIDSYKVVRLDGTVREGDKPYDYVEVIEINSDVNSYKQAMESMPDRPEFLELWRSFIGEFVGAYGKSVED
jgi:hypothetical protein